MKPRNRVLAALAHVPPDRTPVHMSLTPFIQPRSMDPAALKQRYSDKLSFWGTIDEQLALPFGTPENVAGEVRERLASVGRGGGLIIGPTHHVRLDTPMENFLAMVKTIRETHCF